MARLLIAVAVLLLTPFKAHADVLVTVSYRETADLFSTMDNMSDWLPGNTIPAYREEWEARFGWTEADQQWVDRYKEYRRRTILKRAKASQSEIIPGRHLRVARSIDCSF